MTTLRWLCFICLLIQFISAITNVITDERANYRGISLFIAMYTVPVAYFVLNFRG